MEGSGRGWQAWHVCIKGILDTVGRDTNHPSLSVKICLAPHPFRQLSIGLRLIPALLHKLSNIHTSLGGKVS